MPVPASFFYLAEFEHFFCRHIAGASKHCSLRAEGGTDSAEYHPFVSDHHLYGTARRTEKSSAIHRSLHFSEMPYSDILRG